MKTGSCFCESIQFELKGDDYPVANCHCTMCRRTSGAPFVTWLLVPKDDFRVTAGRPKVLKSSDHGTRTFCGDCGTPITCISSRHPERVDITLGSLTHPEQLTPTGDYYEDTRLPWVRPLDGQP
ncbi:MAG: GFA family protein [Proteobacteria bacterium]|jgi:hypothetical protein|nr:GFA family protein [Pseudomonadota bacterium]MDA1301748.1 GFA family protein [Pseudomonadota bacterium]